MKRAFVNDGTEVKWRETFVAYVKVLSQHLFVKTYDRK
jgi:hypothetical protein